MTGVASSTTRAAALSVCLVLACAAHAAAPGLRIERLPFGSGLQNATGIENAEPVGDLGVWHAPQYLPGFPTAATIWPRVVDVPCVKDVCAGYSITPAMGRGEYLFFRKMSK
ncbi:MAG TPA: hypothetical protein VGI11_09550 [Variovorax sp.]